jgi:hypothetical protein
MDFHFQKTRINPRFIQLAIRHDEEINKLLQDVRIFGTVLLKPSWH